MLVSNVSQRAIERLHRSFERLCACVVVCHFAKCALAEDRRHMIDERATEHSYSEIRPAGKRSIKLLAKSDQFRKIEFRRTEFLKLLDPTRVDKRARPDVQSDLASAFL